MTKTAVVFSGRNGLDFIELRSGVLRVPDVTLRIREAQAILEEMGLAPVDLMSVVSSDDDLFFRDIQLKGLCSAIVQVGLFDRFAKTQKRPDYMVGNSNGDSAMMVCAGLMTFRAMIENSQALSTIGGQANGQPGGAVGGMAAPSSASPAGEKVIQLQVAAAMPLLSGLSLTEYSAVESVPGTSNPVQYRPMKASSMELRKLVASLHNDHEVARFINIGPASALRGSDYRMLGSGDIESVDSIELDPMLNWFWRNVRPQAAALAQ